MKSKKRPLHIAIIGKWLCISSDRDCGQQRIIMWKKLSQKFLEADHCRHDADYCVLRFERSEIFLTKEPFCFILGQIWLVSKSVTSLGHQEGGRRVFWEVPKFFKQCPILSNYVKIFFQEKISRGASPTLGPWLRVCRWGVTKRNIRSLLHYPMWTGA